MDPSLKKRKADENGALDGITTITTTPSGLTPSDVRRIIEPFTQDQLLDILQDAACRHADVLDAVRSIADRDPTQRKLFIRGLGWDTTTEGLRSLFSAYGELEEAIVIVDKATGRSKGYGFITFRHIDGALLALKEPSKKIDGRMTVTQLASANATGPTATQPPSVDVSLRKIYVGSVPQDMPSDRLLAHFSSYGEIEEGPLGYDKQTGKSRGYALFVYKTVEGARASLVDPTKVIDGHQLVCKLAVDGKKGKLGAPGAPGAAPAGGVQNQTQGGAGVEAVGDGLGMGSQSSMHGSHGSLSGQFGGPGGLSSYGGFSSGGLPGPAGLSHHHHPLNAPLQSSIGMGTPGLSSVGSQVPTALGGVAGVGAGGYGGGMGGPYGPTSQYGVPGSGGYVGLGVGSSLYRLPPGSVGMPSGGYPEGGHYGLSSSAFPSQHHLPAGSSPGHRVPSGGAYPGVPPYY